MFTLPDNPYEILGVAKNAQVTEIRTAHRKLVLKCHPDKVTDPAQKLIKQEEFQKVQKAYEMLSDENERQKYDDMVMANEMEKDNAERRRRDRERDRDAFTPGRTPPRYESDHRSTPHYTVRVDPGFNVRTAEPQPAFKKSSTFPAPHGSKSPYASTRTPPRSFEDNIHYSSYDEVPRESRRSRKPSVVYEKEMPTRHDEEKRRRKQDDEWDRAQEKAEKSRRKEQERKDAEREKQERKEKERRKDEKRRASEKDKSRDQGRKRETEEKIRHKPPYVEELESDARVYDAPLPKVDKKSKSSSRVKQEVPNRGRDTSRPPLASERERKLEDSLDFAAQYLQTSRSKVPPSLGRAQTYHYNVRHASPPPPAVATPPPAASGVAPPPPMSLDEEVRRSSARTTRRSSHDTPRVKEKSSSSSHKKSSSAREPPIVGEPIRQPPSLKKSNTMPSSHQGTPPSVPESPPKFMRAQTEHYSRPPPGGLPSMQRATTWIPGDEERERSRSRHARAYSDDESEEEFRPRRNQRARSPPDDGRHPTTFRYTVHNGRTVPDRNAFYREESPVGRKGKPTYFMPEANSGRPVERPGMHSFSTYDSAYVPTKVKTAKHYTPDDVSYTDVGHTPSSRELYGY
ncbi:hypothetical protein BJ170DRAFT_681493 [Xylariales sp. AK1849]|nr:hypothetical protein BJ170DRAFT_681493 [Xylariales sp. AK1849]